MSCSRIGVVVPTLNEARGIEACLVSVRAQNEQSDVVVVDCGSTDDTTYLAARHARVIHADRGRGLQMNAGARCVSGDVLLFLHADSQLPDGAFAAIRHALADPSVAGGTFRLRFDHEAPLLGFYAWCTHLRCRLFHYGDQGIFVRRAVFDALGGFREWPLMEDVDFLARLGAEGAVTLLPLEVTTSARRFARHGIVRQQILNTCLVSLYLAGIPPTRLARWYENTHH